MIVWSGSRPLQRIGELRRAVADDDDLGFVEHLVDRLASAATRGAGSAC